jgi:hypothetical protein
VHGEQLALDQIGLHRRAHADGEVGFALREIELAVLEHQMDLQLGKVRRNSLQPRQQPIGAEPVAGGDLERAARRGLRVLQRFLGLAEPRQHIGDGAVEQLAFVGERQPARVALEQGRGDFFFQRADLPAHRRLAEREHLAGMREAARRCDRVKDAKLVPIHRHPPRAGGV